MIRALADAVKWLESQSPENLESHIQKLPIKFVANNELSESQIKLFTEMQRIFACHNDSHKNLYIMKGILHLLSSPMSEIVIPVSERGTGKSWFIFDEKKSLQNLINAVMNIVKNRNSLTINKNYPKYRTVIQGKNVKKEEYGKFSIDEADLQKARIKFTTRKKTKYSFREKNLLSIGKSRIVRFCKKPNGNISIMPTLLNAIQAGNYSLQERNFSIQTNNFHYPKYEQNIIYNIMLVLDTSLSISWAIPHIEKFMPYLTSNVSNSRDKLGLIAFHNGLAQIHHYPILNIKQVIGTINKIETKGHTPLGEGLNLALRVFSRQQYKLPGMKNLIIMISDCFPEPLEGNHKNLLDEPSYKLVLKAVEKINKENIGFIIINPISHKKKTKGWNDKLIDKIKEAISLKYIEIHPTMKTRFFSNDDVIIDENKIYEFFNIVTDVKINL